CTRAGSAAACAKPFVWSCVRRSALAPPLRSGRGDVPPQCACEVPSNTWLLSLTCKLEKSTATLTLRKNPIALEPDPETFEPAPLVPEPKCSVNLPMVMLSPSWNELDVGVWFAMAGAEQSSWQSAGP